MQNTRSAGNLETKGLNTVSLRFYRPFNLDRSLPAHPKTAALAVPRLPRTCKIAAQNIAVRAMAVFRKGNQQKKHLPSAERLIGWNVYTQDKLAFIGVVEDVSHNVLPLHSCIGKYAGLNTDSKIQTSVCCQSLP